MNNDEPTKKICSICGSDYEGYGNNAWPVNTGRCCDRCNLLVVSHRLRNCGRGLSAYAEPEWFHDLEKDLTKEFKEFHVEQNDGTPILKGLEEV